MSGKLNGKVVLVVGASSGIGRETAVLFAREGAHVVASARREAALTKLKEQVAGEGFGLRIAQADASSSAQMNILVSGVLKTFGKIDVLVYAAGTNTKDRAMSRLSVDGWNSMIATNLNGAYYVTEAVLPAMRKARTGLILFVSSISAIVPDVSGAAYQAAKRGLHGLAHAIRVEEKENGIRTCVVCPGLVDTEILDKRPVKPAPEVLAKALQAEDVAEAILFVARLPERATIPEMQIMPTEL